MIIKMEMANQSVPRGGVFWFPTNVLNEAKKATRKYNKTHSNERNDLLSVHCTFVYTYLSPPLWTAFYTLYALMG